MIHHHVKLIRPHHAVETEIAMQRAPPTGTSQEAANLQKHFNAFAVQKRLVVANLIVMPDGIGNGHISMDLQVHVLPGAAILRAGNGRKRKPRAFAI